MLFLSGRAQGIHATTLQRLLFASQRAFQTVNSFIDAFEFRLHQVFEVVETLVEVSLDNVLTLICCLLLHRQHIPASRLHLLDQLIKAIRLHNIMLCS